VSDLIPNCSTCKFWWWPFNGQEEMERLGYDPDPKNYAGAVRISYIDAPGDCRRHAPAEMEDDGAAMWPRTWAAAGCGDHQPPEEES